MNIDELQEYAQKHGFDSIKFEFTNLKGKTIKCQWLDAYMGTFRIEGELSFITVSQWKQTVGESFNFKVIE